MTECIYNRQSKRMRQATTGISVEITRMGANEGTYDVPEGSTLADLLEEANIALSSSETAWVSGVKATMNDEIEDGDVVSIVGKKEGGLK